MAGGPGLYRWLDIPVGTPEEACAIILKVLQGRKYKIFLRVSNDLSLKTDDGLISLYVASNKLKEVLALKDEVDPTDYHDYAMITYLLKGPQEHDQAKSPPWQDDDDVPSRKQRTRRSANSDRPKEKKERASVEGLTSANAIADNIGCPGSAVRAVIRSMKLEKVNGGWWFDEDTAATITKQVKKKLK